MYRKYPSKEFHDKMLGENFKIIDLNNSYKTSTLILKTDNNKK